MPFPAIIVVANQEALADFMWFNMTLEMNVIHSAWQNGCRKLEFLGSSDDLRHQLGERFYGQLLARARVDGLAIPSWIIWRWMSGG